MLPEARPHRIVYVHKGASSFVLKDQRILEAVFRVRAVSFEAPPGAGAVRVYFRALWSLLRTVPKSDAVVCQFGGHHAFVSALISRVFRKPLIVLANGSDCVGFPSLGYGHFRKPLLAWTTRKSFELADRIVPLDDTLVHQRPSYHDLDPPAQGILHHCPGLRTPITPLGYGFDPERWRASGHRSPTRFITVAAGAQKPYVRILKGIDLLIEAAPYFPGMEFLIVGARKGSLPSRPENVREVPFVPHEELAHLYGSANWYLQLSVSEGFGNALCEAMLCGCIPIVSATGAMPRIVDDTGYVVPRRDVHVLVAVIREAISAEGKKDHDAPRDRIIGLLPEGMRGDGLPRIVREVIERK